MAVYVHIPFCRARCSYCDFNTYVGMEPLIPRYVQVLAKEIALWGEAVAGAGGNNQAETLYLGGGTPSLLNSRQITQIVEACRRHLGLGAGAEITMEANPGTVDKAYLEAALAAGVNRLSLGVQSFSDLQLKALGRIHQVEEARQAYHAARDTGFASINLDLLYGLPSQEMQEWQETLKVALELGPDHLSLYCLTAEERTPLAKAISSGAVPTPDPDLAAEMYLLAEEMLHNQVYTHYEISNWAKPGKECQHNLTYWRCQPYLGIGAGAHSCWADMRFHNVLDPAEYVQSFEQGPARHYPDSLRVYNILDPAGYIQAFQPETPAPGRPAPTSPQAAILGMPALEKQSLELIDSSLHLRERLVLGLRLGEGLDLGALATEFGDEALRPYEKEVADLLALGLLQRDWPFLRLTQRGRLLGNEVFVRFVS